MEFNMQSKSRQHRDPVFAHKQALDEMALQLGWVQTERETNIWRGWGMNVQQYKYKYNFIIKKCTKSFIKAYRKTQLNRSMSLCLSCKASLSIQTNTV